MKFAGARLLHSGLHLDGEDDIGGGSCKFFSRDIVWENISKSARSISFDESFLHSDSIKKNSSGDEIC